jgi:hypothetical protein
MSIIPSCLRRLFSSRQNPYELVGAAKKQDGYGEEAIQTWLDAHTIEPGMDKWPTPQVETFVKSFINAMPKNQLTDANIDSVELRFKELSKASGRARRYLFDEIKELDKIDKIFRKTLVIAVICSSSTKY